MPGSMSTGTIVANPASSFTRPPDTTAYAVGDLIANSVTAGSVVPMSWLGPATAGWSYYIAGIRLAMTGTVLTNAQFRIHAYSAAPTIATTGDNGVYKTVVTGATTWIGSFDGTMVAAHADGCDVICVPTEGLVCPVAPSASGTTVYGLIEALAAYTPISAGVFTATLLLEQNVA